MTGILVSVASFCDPLLEQTLADAARKAEDSAALTFAVVDQGPAAQLQALREAVGLKPKLRYLHVEPATSRGVCWARSLAFGLRVAETHLLQIDSHTLFEPGWDRLLLERLGHHAQTCPKPILTTYPPGFEMVNGHPVAHPLDPSSTWVLRPRPDAELRDENLTLRFRAVPVATPHDLPGFHISAGFLFTTTDFIDEVPYDPFLYFHGEEQSLSLRAYTRGWDIIHPHDVPLMHAYRKASDRGTSWHGHPQWDVGREVSHVEFRERARDRLRHLIDGTRNLGAYGLGSARTLADYARRSGIDYQARTIDRRVPVPQWVMDEARKVKGPATQPQEPPMSPVQARQV